MEFEGIPYEEWRKATQWAKIKYKYGLIVMILSWLLLLGIAFYMVYNGEAISRNPLIYGADKFNVSCVCYTEEGYPFYVDSNSISYLAWGEQKEDIIIEE